MPLAPDDLPRSPSGRVPQWALDEATRMVAAAAPADSSRAAERHLQRSRAHQSHRQSYRQSHRQRGRRRDARRGGVVAGGTRGTASVATLVVLAALGGSWWLTHSDAVVPAPIAAVFDALPGVEQPAHLAPVPPPSVEVVALADAAHLSEEGREVFYAARPEILDKFAFAGRCAQGHGSHPLVRTDAVGCYGGAEGRIFVYAPPDPRLFGYVVEIAAHETLHAAWDRLDDDAHARLASLLEAEVALLPVDHAIHEQIASSVGTTPENRPTELFAYVGTQVWRDGGLAPELEAVYGRFVADRAALVAVNAGWQGMLDTMAADIQAALTALTTQRTTNAQQRSQLTADAASVEHYRQSTADEEARLAAMDADERSRLRLSWEWWDGTDLPMAPAAETLAAARALLTRDEAALAARETALAAAEAAAVVERTRIDALVTDLEALHAQLSPELPI